MILFRKQSGKLKSMWVHGQNSLTIDNEDTVKIPESVYFNTRSGNIHVGERTLFSENVMVLTGKHLNILESEMQNLPLHHVPTEGRDIRIGKGCFIGGGAIISGNVTIGDYAVVAAGAVVTKDVPSKTMVAGVPAKVIKHLEVSCTNHKRK